MTSLHDIELERAMAQEAVFDFARFQAFGVSPGDFHDKRLQGVVEAAEELWATSGQVDLESVFLALQRAGKLRSYGGPDELRRELTSQAVPDPAELRRLSRLRRVRETALRAAMAAERGELDGAMGLMQEGCSLAEETSQRGRVVTAPELYMSALERISESNRASRIHLGLPKLANAIGTLPLGSMTVVAGNTSVGKSSFVQELMLSTAERNVKCGIVSLEDPEEIQGERLLSVFGKVSSRQFRIRDITEAESGALSRGYTHAERLGERFMFVDCSGGTEIDVAAAMTRMHARGAKLIVVDYIGEIQSSQKQQDRRNEIRWIASRLKSHAKRLGVAMVLVSQLARPADGKPSTKPTKHSLKESGDLENSAEVIIALWREKEHDFAPVNVEVLKCKWGGLGQSWLMQRQKYNRQGELGDARLYETDDPRPEWAE